MIVSVATVMRVVVVETLPADEGVVDADPVEAVPVDDVCAEEEAGELVEAVPVDHVCAEDEVCELVA